jgi:3-methylcrotonyl-CoA carboxylase alpha subunit
MAHRIRWEGREVQVELEPLGEAVRARVDGREHRVALRAERLHDLMLEVDGQRRRIVFARDGGALLVALDGETFRLEPVEPGARSGAARHHDHGLEAPMPGLVRSIAVAEGDAVVRGQTLVVLEAMKMEIRITAPEDARIVKLRCAVGERVERGQELVDLDGSE